MTTHLITPLTRQTTMSLRAGDEILLDGRVVLIWCDERVSEQVPRVREEVQLDGAVCFFVSAQADVNDGSQRPVVRLDEPVVDRSVASLLARGALGFIAAGRCPGTASYALRKYGGVFFAVPSDWDGIYRQENAGPSSHDRTEDGVSVVEVRGVRLTVAHDAFGHDSDPQSSATPKRVVEDRRWEPTAKDSL